VLPPVADVAPGSAPPLAVCADPRHAHPRRPGSYADLFANGLAVRDGFLSPARLRGLIGCAELRRARGDFAAARVGADHRLQQRDIRGDSTCWLSEPLFADERGLLDDLEALRLDLNRGFLGLFDLEVHYARYPPGGGYARHVDQLYGCEQRQVSLIVYLNDAWTPAAGGELRVFGAAGDYLDIEPVGGRLVCFLTEGREHAVLATHRERLSLSGWFRRRG
jgi:SM-20-related protein